MLRSFLYSTARTRPAWYKSGVQTQRSLFSTTRSSLFRASSLSLNQNKNKEANFNDTQTAYAGLTTPKLVRGWVVLKICSIEPIVANAEKLLPTSRKIFGDTFIKFFVHPTFFSHFCAGEGEESIKPTVQWLKTNKIGAILDYAAEADIEEEDKQPELPSSETTNILLNTNSPVAQHYPTARTYQYSTEKECDANLEIFASAIRAVKNVTPEGFAAIKITALGNPLLLERWSSSIVEIRALFHRMDSSGSGKIHFDEFIEAWKQYFVLDGKKNYHTLF